MDYTLIRDIYKDSKKFADETIKIGGWIRTSRISSNLGFIELNDGTFFKSIQIVFENCLENHQEISKLSGGSSVTVSGQLKLTPDAKQPFEIHAQNIEVEGESSPEYPLQKKRHSFEFMRTIAHLRPRANTFSAVFRIRSIASYAIHKFFQERGFVYVHTPIITANDAEGAGEMFTVTTLNPTKDSDFSKDFFGKQTSLTVSGQLLAETYSMAFRDVYTFGPTFRAENSNTARHAAEFWMLEPEIAFADIFDNMRLAEDMLKYITSYILENCTEEMNFLNSFVDKTLIEKLNTLINSEFGHITYTEAIETLKKSGKSFEYPVEWGIDLQTEHERYIAEEVYNRPVFVTDYPKEIKAFYMRLNDDGKTVAAMDLLVPQVGELIGGSQREERLDVLQSKFKEFDLNAEEYWWYAELRKYGGVKHSGYGLGFDRYIMYVTGMTNIRDVIPFPRTVNNVEF